MGAGPVVEVVEVAVVVAVVVSACAGIVIVPVEMASKALFRDARHDVTRR